MRYICFDKHEIIKPIGAWHSIGRKGTIPIRKNGNNAWLFLGYNGVRHFVTDGEEHVLERGTFHVVFPEAVSSSMIFDDTEQSDFCCEFTLPNDYFVVEADRMEDIIDENLCVLPEFSKINDCEKYLVIFSQLVDELLNLRVKDSLKIEICDNYTKILLCSLSDAALRYSGESKRRVSVEKIFYWIGKNAKEGITAKDAAVALNYNSDYLNQIVKAETGMTLTKYINHLRITEAKNLLLNSDMKISQIAFAVGFSDEKYFMRIFKEHENTTPIQYRNSYFWKNISG